MLRLISPEQAKALADNPNNALTEDQRAYLRTLSDRIIDLDGLVLFGNIQLTTSCRGTEFDEK